MTAWQVQEAKQRFSEVLREATTDGPQIITRHGEEVAVVLSIDSYHQLASPRVELADYLLHGPVTQHLEIERDRTPMREAELGELV
ncbi:type II toxin-antitoxin system Phd/YefM family antitoxin [Antribacter sp. KLBMP9083]|uniref:Antitoxin n=1 Tax=Antribacter soli TaxID=2910976 RepID=A0AA41QDH6_9MICO|nr:type II toxin-antitoxin system Phd/YefM family antitoxin [Antribacter soli]MCF4121450.1 type II toxin-antitoxin system Phd/YefM family antitoxin [Antribacter soli]